MMAKRWSKLLRDEWHPVDEIRIGDIILFNKKPRKVRALARDDRGRIANVMFAILRPSWTDRPFTIYFRADLKRCFGGIVGSNSSLCTVDIECRTQREIEASNAGERTRFISAKEMAGLIT